MKKMNLWIGRYGFAKCTAALYLAGIILGILSSFFYFRNPQNSLEDFYFGIQTNITENGIVYREFLQIVFWKQIKGILLLLLVSISFLGPYWTVAYVVYKGFVQGFFLVSLLWQWGGKGMLLFLASDFPQLIFFVPLYMVLLYHCYSFSQNNVRKSNIKRKTPLSKVSFLLILFLCFFFGCLSEAYLNAGLTAYTLSAIL